jgi:aldehyde dehydrogenase family 7 protein A1
VYGWNSALALICGNQLIWKGSETASLASIATSRIVAEVLKKNGFNSVATLCQGTGAVVGEKMINDKRIPLVSFTGSTKTGRHVASTVAGRFGRSILELGGNNASIVMPDADLEIAFKGSVFAAVGTCGQRCTSLRRLIVHDSVFDQFAQRMVAAYKTIRIGDPLDPDTLVGPLHSKEQVQTFITGIDEAKKQGGRILVGGEVLEMPGNFVQPTIIEIDSNAECLQHELFVPILYMMRFSTYEEAVKINNSVPQGLSSSIYTRDVRNFMNWIGPLGSDCGIANLNIGPSGAEIGGAFGGEKETGGGREAGSDSWKQYMRRSTCTANFSNELPLAQGVKFDV